MPLNLWVIILHWNSEADTSACVAALLQNRTGQEVRVTLLVVDNGSGDDLPRCWHGRFDARVRVLRLPRNLGYAGGNNRGIEMALAAGADLILLLNNDTTMPADFLAHLLAAARRHPGTGIFGCKIFYADPADRLWYAGGRLQPGLARTRHLGLGQRDHPRFQQEREVDFVTGCAMLVRSPVFAKIGLLDETLFLYYEDVDFCRRAQRAGIAMRYVPAAVLWHKVGAGAGHKLTPLYLYYQTRNRPRVWRRGRGRLYRAWLLFLHLCFYSGMRLVYVGLCGARPRPLLLAAIWRGCRDGLRFHAPAGS
ncbi:MAG: glycosyltransferase family 2 protein [candidate division KSB1 bacterium]|nr:glycosyltransferase family 2 protein [candidate division KSB1 bacterium]MDZ7275507.1 glycosyltransferase family 2 protein [candidate division KSB1 bacterium]MDZ7286181.1 glycosyltransferase family 2 protein [candidate division KSB1 bacterium]MDZ7296407.1 glycosyltransferase family 2 protein [candidate division KSB1 bacterium]MDZ7306242.1 glycosyltransferase family 2 protein [candidate division KSB1 bacterium]